MRRRRRSIPLKPSDPDLEPVEAIYDALDQGRPDRALDLARKVLAAEAGDPVTRFLAGAALLDLDRPEEAAAEFAAAVDIDPDDPEFRANQALALFRCCAFEEARQAAERAVSLAGDLPDGHHVLALALERRGDFAGADEHFRRAARGDGAAFPEPRRLEAAAFNERVQRAAARLPEQFRRHLDDVAVTVEDLPSEAILREEDPPLDPELLGLFVGLPLSMKSHLGPGGELPPRILIFKRNLERFFPEPGELTAEIARTLHHELGHYLGLDEDELAAIGLR